VGQDKKNTNIDALLGKRATRSQTEATKVERGEREFEEALLRKLRP
jgi:hypothetical protein